MIHVLIERQVAEGMLANYQALLKTILQQSFVTQGYLSGEAFHDINDEHNHYVWCKWRSVQDWQHWQHSEARRSIVQSMQALLVREEKITLLTP